MTISAELVATAILGVSLVSLGWKVSSDIRHELKQEMHYVREDVAGGCSRSPRTDGAAGGAV
jgi:hypothetical protein